MWIELRGLEDRFIGFEVNAGTVPPEWADLFQAAGGFAAPERLPPFAAIAADGGDEFLRQGVYHRRADAMQTAGVQVVASFTELGARVERRQDKLQGRPLEFGMEVDGNAPAVVGDRHRVAILV